MLRTQYRVSGKEDRLDKLITTYGLFSSAIQVYQQSAIICFMDADFAMALLKGIVHLSSAGYQI